MPQVRSGGDVLSVRVDITHCHRSDLVVMSCLLELTLVTAAGQIFGDVMSVGVDITHCHRSDLVVISCLLELTLLTATGQICW